MQLDFTEYSKMQTAEIMDKVKLIDTATAPTFIKDEYPILKLDLKAYELRQQYEEEEAAKVKKKQDEEHELANRKSDAEIFSERLYDFQNVKKMAERIANHLSHGIDLKVKDAITNSSQIVKLMEFYNEEFGSEEEE